MLHLLQLPLPSQLGAERILWLHHFSSWVSLEHSSRMCADHWNSLHSQSGEGRRVYPPDNLPPRYPTLDPSPEYLTPWYPIPWIPCLLDTLSFPQKGHGIRDTLPSPGKDLVPGMHYPPCEQIDRHLWKHYFSVTLFLSMIIFTYWFDKLTFNFSKFYSIHVYKLAHLAEWVSGRKTWF